MLKKYSNIGLIILLAILIGVYFLVQWSGDRTKSDSFKNLEIKLDTSEVNNVKITGKAGNTQLVKEADGWKLNLASGKVVNANSGAVKSALETLQGVRPSRIITKNEANWAGYEVDSTGTRVTISANGKNQLDLIIGRFIVEGQNSFATYMRLADAPEVFSVQNFMPFSISADPSIYRNNVISRIQKSEIISVTFNYMDDTFVLTSDEAGWKMDENPINEAQVNEFIQNLTLLTGKEFYDEPIPGEPTATIHIQTSEKDISIEIFEADEMKFVKSSINEESAFTDATIFDKILKSRDFFLE